MCGIVGVITSAKTGFYKQDIDIFKSLLVVNSLRGAHSTGAFGVRRDNLKIEFAKTIGSPFNFFAKKETNKFLDKAFMDYKAMIGHGRYATRGSINPHNAHPFLEDNLILVHNGTIYNQSELEQKLDSKHDVDSAIITKAIKKLGIEETLQLIHGAFALSFYDENTKILSMVRNEDRPLHVFFSKKDSRTIFASESEAIEFVLNRSSAQPVTSSTILAIEEGYLYSFNLETDDWDRKKIKFREKPTYYGHGGRRLGRSVWDENYEYAGWEGWAGNQKKYNRKEDEKNNVVNFNKSAKESLWHVKVGDKVKFNVTEGKALAEETGKNLFHFKGELLDNTAVFCWGNIQYEEKLLAYDGPYEGEIASIFPITMKDKPNINVGVVINNARPSQVYPSNDTEIKLANARVSLSVYQEYQKLGCGSCGGELREGSHVFQILDVSEKRLICANCAAN